MLLREQSKFQGSIYRAISLKKREEKRGREQAEAREHRRRVKRSRRRKGEDAGPSVGVPTAPGGTGAETALRPHLQGDDRCFGAVGLRSRCTVLSLFLPEAQCPPPPPPHPPRATRAHLGGGQKEGSK